MYNIIFAMRWQLKENTSRVSTISVLNLLFRYALSVTCNHKAVDSIHLSRVDKEYVQHDAKLIVVVSCSVKSIGVTVPPPPHDAADAGSG